MKLYWAPPMASLAVLILAYETDRTLELVPMDMESRRMPNGLLLSQINPKNCMPVLERDDGSILTETAVILDWLAAQDPQLRLTAPAHSEDHMRITEWMVFFASEQHKLATLLFWDIDETAKLAVRTRVIERFEPSEKALETSHFLVGNRLTIADLYLLVMVRGSIHLFEGFDPEIEYPRLNAWMERVVARPAVQRAMRDHGLGDAVH
ncbi:glutathione S-transferase [Sphingopyxis panaciterrae]|uniref:glutathione binding-like protein n=1 Tax=Sphingopyxis panaciterrae TaxID=363841 RepID=UPI001420B1D6|nr:glutathione binding-like protein [Sphingopyxis panaciterrae]NIJ37557.1 glutathione S-transferase [Sphingopyxis panaciterrae]